MKKAKSKKRISALAKAQAELRKCIEWNDSIIVMLQFWRGYAKGKDEYTAELEKRIEELEKIIAGKTGGTENGNDII